MSPPYLITFLSFSLLICFLFTQTLALEKTRKEDSCTVSKTGVDEPGCTNCATIQGCLSSPPNAFKKWYAIDLEANQFFSGKGFCNLTNRIENSHFAGTSLVISGHNATISCESKSFFIDWVVNSETRSYATFLADLRLVNCFNPTADGGCIRLSVNTNDPPTTQLVGWIESVTVAESTSAYSGGALAAIGSPLALNMNDCVFDRCQAQNGGAIFTQNTTVSIQQSFFSANAAMLDGGAVSVTGGQAKLSNCRFQLNQAVSGQGGAVVLNGGSWDTLPYIADALFESNFAKQGGGAVALLSLGADGIFGRDTVDLTAITFVSNLASNGGAIYVDSCRLPALANSLLKQNVASQFGGALYWTNVLGCDRLSLLPSMNANQAGISGGGIFIDSIQCPSCIQLEGTLSGNTPDQIACSKSSAAFCARGVDVSSCADTDVCGLGAVLCVRKNMTSSECFPKDSTCHQYQQ